MEKKKDDNFGLDFSNLYVKNILKQWFSDFSMIRITWRICQNPLLAPTFRISDRSVWAPRFAFQAVSWGMLLLLVPGAALWEPMPYQHQPRHKGTVRKLLPVNRSCLWVVGVWVILYFHFFVFSTFSTNYVFIYIWSGKKKLFRRIHVELVIH